MWVIVWYLMRACVSPLQYDTGTDAEFTQRMFGMYGACECRASVGVLRVQLELLRTSFVAKLC